MSYGQRVGESRAVMYILCCPQVMSFFHYTRKCDNRQLSLPIEPLVRAMRHPFVIPACNPPVRILCAITICTSDTAHHLQADRKVCLHSAISDDQYTNRMDELAVICCVRLW